MICASTRSLAPATFKALGWISRVPARDRKVSVRQQHTAGHVTSDYTLSTEDKLEIIELCNRFDQAVNMGKQDALGQFFSHDALINVDMQIPSAPIKTVKGVQPIVDFFVTLRPTASGNRHLTCNIVVEADGVRAARVTAYRILHKAANPPALLATGILQDRLVNVNGEWKFTERNFIMDPPASATGI